MLKIWLILIYFEYFEKGIRVKKIKILGLVIIIVMGLFACSQKENRQQDLNVESLPQFQQQYEIEINDYQQRQFKVEENNNQPGQQYEIKDDFDDYIEYENEDNFGFIIVTFATRDGSRSIKITEYLGENTEIRIPPTIQGLPVTLIEEAFNNKKITNFKLPDSIFNIGHQTFANNNLSSVIIPNTIHSISDRAFYNNQLTNIIIPNSVGYVGVEAFVKNQVVSITIGENVNLATTEYMKEGIVFDNNFDEFYETNGSKAGTYIYVNDNWRIQ
jgi:hypothetical protein